LLGLGLTLFYRIFQFLLGGGGESAVRFLAVVTIFSSVVSNVQRGLMAVTHLFDSQSTICFSWLC